MAAPFDISQAWNPDIWRQAMREKMATRPSVWNSGIALRSPLFDALADGAGTSVNVPFYLDATDQDDAIQIEDTAPTAQSLSTAKQIAPILNRVTSNSATALSGQISGTDPVGEITDQLVTKRLKQRNKTLIAVVRGAFNALGANAAAAPLKDVRLDSFDETGTDATADQTFGSDLFIQAKALMLELEDDLNNGALLVHPNVRASLEIADALSFKTGVASALGPITTYRGVPIFTSSRLVRAGTTNGFVFDSYLFAPGIVAIGEKTQAYGSPNNPILGVATVNVKVDVDKNNASVIDRSRFMVHLNGMKFVGAPAGQSATDAELSTAANWNYVYSSVNRAGIVCVRTNA